MKGITFCQLPVEITKVFSARNYDTIQHSALVFMEELAGVKVKFTANPLYISFKKELSTGEQASTKISCGYSCSTG